MQNSAWRFTRIISQRNVNCLNICDERETRCNFLSSTRLFKLQIFALTGGLTNDQGDIQRDMRGRFAEENDVLLDVLVRATNPGGFQKGFTSRRA